MTGSGRRQTSRTSGGRRLRVQNVVVSGVVVVVISALAVMRDGPARGPVTPYDHSGFSEVSVATEDVVSGQARTVAQGLAQRGYWCVQPRRNDLAVQIRCQSAGRDVQVDLVAGPGGDVVYADIDLGPAAAPVLSSQDAWERIGQVLNASFLLLWPQDRATIEGLLEDAQPSGMAFGRAAPPVEPAKQYSTHDQRTEDASWSLWSLYTGEPLALRVRTAGLKDRSWPFGSGHYATSLEAARTDLLADGFTCTPSSCHRASDGTAIDFDEHNGQIVAARFTLRSSVEGGGGPGQSEQWVRADLPFLTPAVQAAVGARVEQSRRQHQSWRGVVAGTPVDIVAAPGAASMPDGRPARELAVMIGIPLVQVE